MTTYTAPDLTGLGAHARVDVTDEQLAAFGDTLARIFDEGVARFGSVDAFEAALGRYNAERRARREVAAR